MKRALFFAFFSFACACKREVEISVPPEMAADAAPARTSTSAFFTVSRSHFVMGSQMTLTAWTTDEAGVLSAYTEAFAVVDQLDKLLSTWQEGSEVSRVNAAAGVAPVKVGPETLEAVERGLEGSAKTNGKFDITFGALSGLWKFDHDQDNSIPSRAEIEKRLPFVRWEGVRVDRAASTVFLEDKGMRMHLGGIGKGFAVDRVVALLRGRGHRDFMVQFGGDLFVAGRHGDRAWRVGIRDPRGAPDRYFAATEVTDATFSTSGDYERFFIKDGRRYHHILDPDTGEPARGCRSVTIMAPDGTTAEWLSKGVFILGPQEGLALVERTPGAGAVIVDDDNGVYVSDRLKGKLKVFFEPTK